MTTPEPILLSIDLSDARSVCDVLDAGAEANLSSPVRSGSVDRISWESSPSRVIATGDIHDNPLHLRAVVRAAGLEHAPGDPGHDPSSACHLTLHEIIHGELTGNGLDLSYRALARVAALKAAHPSLVHTLLANHELAQVIGAGIVKNGVRVVDAFNDGLSVSFGDAAGEVAAAIERFVRSMPLALRASTPRGGIVFAHSLPGVAAMATFDATLLDREVRDEDLRPPSGSAYRMVWGRGYDAEQTAELGEAWGASLFVLGHEHVESGVELRTPNTIVLNSDHERGVYLPIDLASPPTPSSAAMGVIPLRAG